MVTGNTRRDTSTLDKVKRVAEARKGEIIFGLNVMVNRGRTVFVADVTVHEIPTAEQLSEIAISSARVVKLFGYETIEILGDFVDIDIPNFEIELESI